jgi:hypothetical protein
VVAIPFLVADVALTRKWDEAFCSKAGDEAFFGVISMRTMQASSAQSHKEGGASPRRPVLLAMS